MIETAAVAKRAIRSHYDLATPSYRLLWGPHIHHVLWSEADAAREVPRTSPRAAQECLTDTLADLARVGHGRRELAERGAHRVLRHPVSMSFLGSPWKKSSGRFSKDENLRFSRTLRVRDRIPAIPQDVYPQPVRLVWLAPVVTLDRAVLMAVWTVFILVGSTLEDRRLLFFIGDEYRSSRARVPGYPGMLAGPLARVPSTERPPLAAAAP